MKINKKDFWMLKNIEGKNKKQLKTIHFKEKDMIDNLGKKTVESN